MMRRSYSQAVAISLVWTPLAHAHTGRAPAPHDVWSAWTVAPFVVCALAASAFLYARGTRAVWAHAGSGRGIPAWRTVAFAAGLLILALALLSPIDAVGSALFSVHMVQHLLLVVVAAPLLVLGEPQYVVLWAVRVGARRRLAVAWRAVPALRATWHALVHPAVAWSVHVAVLWAWHLPRFYDAALRDERIHVIEHTSFLVTALLFWWVVLHRRHVRVGIATFYLFAAALQGTLLGALLTLARHAWYHGHLGITQAWGLTPLEDQQLAGLIMWIPAGFVYLLAMIPPLLRILTDSRRRELDGMPRVRRPERSEGPARAVTVAIALIAVTFATSCSTVVKAIEAVGSLSTPEADIRDVRARSNKAIAAHDLEAVTATMASDIVVTGGNGGVSIGRDSVRAVFARAFADPTFIDYLRTPDSITVSTARPALAAERGHWMGRFHTPNGIEDIGGAYLAMWRRTNEGWRIRSELFVSLSCHGPRMCTP